MCGIAGIFGPGAADRDLLLRMGQAIAHRGPDDHGVWTDPGAGIGLSHRRLSIVDLSPTGHQPMESSDGRWVICFNGEIYNHGEIRSRLEHEGKQPQGGWRGHSDTEVLVQSIGAWGLDKAIDLAVGMFAFALWDRRERKLHLVRDRFGEKPLYVGQSGRDVVFASELKSFRKHPDFDGEIDRGAVAALLSFTAIPAPLSIFRSVFKQLPGTILTISNHFDPCNLSANLLPGQTADGLQYRRYWSYADVIETGHSNSFADRAEAMQAVEDALADSVSGQSMADVPIGAFLSGGIDSSLVAAIYQRSASQPIKTYTIGFSEAEFDESGFAAAVARHLGTDHHELIVAPDTVREIIPRLPLIYDEPFADSSQIPTFIVSQYARQSVTVALTGDGGDELFAGYNRHVLGSQFWNAMSRLPSTVRRMGASILAGLPHQLWSVGTVGPKGPRYGRKIQKGLRIAATARDLDEVYASFVDEWYGQPSPILGGERWRVATPRISDRIEPAARMAFWDACSYLPDDILVKVDRAAMAVSLETRVPFLDPRVAAVAARVPASMKVDGRGGKAILRDLLARHLPPDLFERPKTGFGIPIGDWLRGPLRDWGEALLDARRLGEDGWLDPVAVGRCWQAHQSGQRDAAPALWAILMFNAWLEQQ